MLFAVACGVRMCYNVFSSAWMAVSEQRDLENAGIFGKRQNPGIEKATCTARRPSALR